MSLGVTVELLEPVKGLPDLVFTANAGLMYGNRFLSSRFKHEQRAKESPVFDAWFAAHGFAVEHLPAEHFHEGAGDALFCGDVLFAGYRQRSDATAHQWVANHFGGAVPAAGTGQPAVLPPGHVLLPARPWGGRLPTRRRSTPTACGCWPSQVPMLIAVVDEEARRFGCNAVVVGTDGGPQQPLPADSGLRWPGTGTRRWRWSWTSS